MENLPDVNMNGIPTFTDDDYDENCDNKDYDHNFDDTESIYGAQQAEQHIGNVILKDGKLFVKNVRIYLKTEQNNVR